MREDWPVICSCISSFTIFSSTFSSTRIPFSRIRHFKPLTSIVFHVNVGSSKPSLAWRNSSTHYVKGRKTEKIKPIQNLKRRHHTKIKVDEQKKMFEKHKLKVNFKFCNNFTLPLTSVLIKSTNLWNVLLANNSWYTVFPPGIKLKMATYTGIYLVV